MKIVYRMDVVAEMYRTDHDVYEYVNYKWGKFVFDFATSSDFEIHMCCKTYHFSTI